VVSTDNDTLFRYELNDAGTNVVTIEKVFCADPRRRDGDWHHLNSVTEWRRELYVAMFGTSDALAHIDRRNGRVMRLSDGATIAEGLYHPHSLFAHGDELLVVESHAHAVRRIAGGPRAEWKIEGGYPRGIVADDDMIWVGVSALRQESSSLGTPNIITSSSPLDFCTRLVELDPATARIGRTIDLSHLAAEIFDVRAMPFGATFTPSPDGGLSERIEALEESFQTLRAASKVLERRLENPFQRLKRVARRIRHRFALKAIT
jgi:Domain of unknown function (DUF4915)